jgi:hypothetical protein
VIAKLDRLSRNVHFISGLMERLGGPRLPAINETRQADALANSNFGRPT